MQLVVSGIKAECPRCKGTDFDRMAPAEGTSQDALVLRCNSCSTRRMYGELLAVVAQRALDAEKRRMRP